MKITVIIMILNLILIFHNNNNNNNNINGDLSLYTNRPFALRDHVISFL